MMRMVRAKIPRSFVDPVLSLVVFPAQPVFHRHLQVLVLLTALYLMIRFYRFLMGQPFFQQCNRPELVAIVWLGSACLFLGLIAEFEVRYAVVVVPPLCVLGARAIAEISTVSMESASAGSADYVDRKRTTAVLMTIFSLPVVNLLWPLLERAFGRTQPTRPFEWISAEAVQLNPPSSTEVVVQTLEKLAAGLALVGLVGILVYRLLSTEQRKKIASIMLEAYPPLVLTWATLAATIFLACSRLQIGTAEGLSMQMAGAVAIVLTMALACLAALTSLQNHLPGLARWSPAMLLTAFLLIHGIQVGAFLLRPTFDVAATTQKLRPYLGPGTVVMGDLADTLALGTDAFSFRSYFGMNQDGFERFRPDYVLQDTHQASADMPVELRGGYRHASSQTQFLERFSLLPLDRHGMRYKILVDLFAVEGRGHELQDPTPKAAPAGGGP